MTKKELHILINRYFNGETSLDEERQLRRELAHTSWSGSEVDEARAVMGFALCAPVEKPVRKTAAPILYRRAAAAIAAAVITSSTLIFYPKAPENGECVAYLNGEEISNQQIVMSMMMQDLSEIGEASKRINADVANDINEIADIINNGI